MRSTPRYPLQQGVTWGRAVLTRSGDSPDHQVRRGRHEHPDPDRRSARTTLTTAREAATSAIMLASAFLNGQLTAEEVDLELAEATGATSREYADAFADTFLKVLGTWQNAGQ